MRARALVVEQKGRALRRTAGGCLPHHRDTTLRQRLERLRRPDVRLGVSDARARRPVFQMAKVYRTSKMNLRARPRSVQHTEIYR